MALYFDFSARNEPTAPDQYAFEANDEAVRAGDARRSREALERQVRDAVNHRSHQKLFEASRSRLILLCGFLAFGFLLLNLWEWAVSRDIYEIWFPMRPWIPFIGCIVISFYASACLGESSAHFSLFSLAGEQSENSDDDIAQRVVGSLYGRRHQNKRNRRKMSGWILHPAIGALIALLFLSGIYLASRERVRLLSQAGEAPAGSSFQVYLPVVLYAVEILLGIPTFFFIVSVQNSIRMRRLRKKLTRARDGEVTIRQSAVRKYMNYIEQLEAYNSQAAQNDGLQRPLVPPNQPLRELLVQEYGYDPTGTDRQLQQYAGNPSDEADGPEAPSGPEVPAPGDNDGRVRDLINLVDDQIDQQNRGI